MTRWFIGRSGAWEKQGYPVKKIMQIVKQAGGKNIRTAHVPGYPKNKPVVCFSGSKTDANIVIYALLEEMAKTRPEFKNGTVWALAKNW